MNSLQLFLFFRLCAGDLSSSAAWSR